MAKIENSASKEKKVKYVHREDALWLTEDICKEYRDKAKNLAYNGGQDSGEWQMLRVELQKLCDITEIEAINILRGMNIRDYVSKYEILSGKKEAAKTKGGGKAYEILEQIAELESKLEIEMMLQRDSD